MQTESVSLDVYGFKILWPHPSKIPPTLNANGVGNISIALSLMINTYHCSCSAINQELRLLECLEKNKSIAFNWAQV